MRVSRWLAGLGLAVLTAGTPLAAHEGHDQGQRQRLVGTVVASEPGRLIIRTASGAREAIRLTRATRFASGGNEAGFVPGRRVVVDVSRTGDEIIATDVRLGVLDAPSGETRPRSAPRPAQPPVDSGFDAEDEEIDRAPSRSHQDCERAYREGYRDGGRSALDADPYAGFDEDDEEEWDDSEDDHGHRSPRAPRRR